MQSPPFFLQYSGIDWERQKEEWAARLEPVRASFFLVPIIIIIIIL